MFITPYDLDIKEVQKKVRLRLFKVVTQERFSIFIFFLSGAIIASLFFSDVDFAK